MARDRFKPGITQAQVGRVVTMTWAFTLERVRGIEPPLSAWEADVLPLNYTRTSSRLTPGRALTILAIGAGRRFGSSARGTAPEETEGGSSWIWSSGSWLRLSCW